MPLTTYIVTFRYTTSPLLGKIEYLRVRVQAINPKAAVQIARGDMTGVKFHKIEEVP